MLDVLDVETMQCTHALREVDMYTMVVNQDTLHLEVGLLAILLILEFDECILQAIASALVSNDLAG